MAHTLSRNLNPQPPIFSSFVPPPSQEFTMLQMPNVFVIPPEEELDINPPWCYFDATQATRDSLSTLPDMDAIDVALRLCQQRDNRAPAFHRSFTNESQETIVMPRRGSIMKLHDMNLEMEDGQTDIRSRTAVRRFDDEIVEVVKVRRNEGVSDVGQVRKMKKSNTFRARASQALRAIKLNVGKGHRSVSLSGRRSQGDLETAVPIPTRHSFQEVEVTPRPTSPSVSRRRSLTFSQLFAFKEHSQRSRPASPSEEPVIPSSPTLVSSSEHAPSRPMSPTESVASQPRQPHPSPALEEYTVPAMPAAKLTSLAPEPLEAEDASKPTLSKRKSFRRRLSVLEIQKLFTIGGSSSSHPVETTRQEVNAEDAHPRPKSMDLANLFTASSSRPGIGSTSTSTSTITGDHPSRISSSSQSSGGRAEVSDPMDPELEMRLDSLHFDSIHFDPDEILSSL